MSAAEDFAGGDSSLEFLSEAEGRRLCFVGNWTTRELTRHDAALRRLDLAGAQRVVVDLSRCSAIDSAGAWVLERTLNDLKQRGVAVELAGTTPAIETLLGTVTREVRELPPAPKPDWALVAVALRVGRETFRIGREANGLLSFLGLTVMVFLRSLMKPWRIRFTSLIAHMEQTGLNALPIVGLISFLVGIGTSARTRGITRTSMGSRPRVCMASTSSFTFMVPIWAVKEEPERPATMIAVSRMPISRSTPTATRFTVKICAPKRASWSAPW